MRSKRNYIEWEGCASDGMALLFCPEIVGSGISVIGSGDFVGMIMICLIHIKLVGVDGFIG